MIEPEIFLLVVFIAVFRDFIDHFLMVFPGHGSDPVHFTAQSSAISLYALIFRFRQA